MNICFFVQGLVDFLLWHLTWGWNQLGIQLVLVWFFLPFFTPLGWVRSFFYSLFLHVSSSLIIIFMIGSMSLLCKIPTQPDTSRYLVVYTDIQKITIPFALMYGAVMFVIALLAHGILPVPRMRLAIVIVLSGILSALIVPIFIRFV